MRNVDNYFSNSVKFLKDLGPSLVEAGKKSKMRKDRYSALIIANMAARGIMRAPTPQEYNFYGGFATMDGIQRKGSETMFTGPNWFTENMKDVY